jgi:predicted RNA polymerase sigma factor
LRGDSGLVDDAFGQPREGLEPEEAVVTVFARVARAGRADLLWRLARQSEADSAYARAAALAPTEAERQFLSRGGRGAR